MSEAIEEKRYLTVGDLQARFGLSADTIYRMEKRQQLPPRVQIGQRRLWWGKSINEWESQRLTEAGLKP